MNRSLLVLGRAALRRAQLGFFIWEFELDNKDTSFSLGALLEARRSIDDTTLGAFRSLTCKKKFLGRFFLLTKLTI